MKYNLFTFLILLFSTSILFYSCEKELLGCTDPTASNYNDLANTDDGSCIEPVLGCTDLNAMNYESLASSDDGTCIYAYDLALGDWDINTECDDLTISILGLGDIPVPLNDVFPESIEIFAEGEGVISMDINGEPILADVSADGTVVFAGYHGSFGKVIRIRHSFGIMTTYGHLAKINIKRGDIVNEGQIIGKMGRTGRVNGAHLHYEISVNGKSQNPKTFSTF